MNAKEKIENLRKEKGWSKSRLAKEIGVSSTCVYNWYNEKNSNPNRDTIEDVCAVFDIPVSSFYADFETDDLPPEEIELLEVFRRLSPKKKETALMIIKNLND